MRINIFEGSRRIIWVIAALILAISSWNIAFPSAYVVADFELNKGPTASPIERCPYGNSSSYLPIGTFEGDGASVRVCFGGTIHTAGAQADRQAAIDAASVDKRIIDLIRPEVSKLAAEKRNANRIDAVIVGAGCLAGLFFVTYIIGWIVRGFAGIPRGKDTRGDRAA